MGESAAPVLSEAKARADQALKTATPDEAAPRPEHLEDLILSLRQQSLSARHRFDTLTGELRSMLGDVRFQLLQDQMENLQFMEAAQVLEELRPPVPAGMRA